MLRFLRHGYGHFEARRPIGPAEWPHHDLLFVHRGAVALTFPRASRELTLRSGQGVLIWPRTPFHGRVTTRQARASIQHFKVEGTEPEPFNGLLNQRGGWSEQTMPHASRLTRDVERALEAARKEGDSSRRLVMRRALLALVLVEGGFLETTPERGPSKRIARESMAAWLQPRWAQNPGVAALARVAGLSPSRFRAVFRAEHGCPAGEFLRTQRSAEACRLLAETNLPLKTIAAGLGYADVVAFHRAFKARAGCTPGQYRRRHGIIG